MHNEKDLITELEARTPHLSPEARTSLWHSIEPHITSTRTIPSPYTFSLFITHTKTMTALVLALIFIIGSGGTALASDAARPGDLLFPLEREIEDMQLRFASNEARAALLTKLTEERLAELREIIDEEIVVSTAGVLDTSNEATTASSTLYIEADVFTDTTVVKIELNGTQFYFETAEKMRGEIVAAIITRFPLLTNTDVETRLELETENRASRPQDRGITSFKARGEARVQNAMSEILAFLDDTRIEGEQKNHIRETARTTVEGTPKVRRDTSSVRIESDDDSYKVRLDDNGDSRIEVRDAESRVRIEETDGVIRIEEQAITIPTIPETTDVEANIDDNTLIEERVREIEDEHTDEGERVKKYEDTEENEDEQHEEKDSEREEDEEDEEDDHEDEGEDD